jgi:hypothetical protein
VTSLSSEEPSQSEGTHWQAFEIRRRSDADRNPATSQARRPARLTTCLEASAFSCWTSPGVA